MQEIQQKAIETYQSNLKYFQQHHPHLYQKLIALDAAIASDQYQECYSLEYKEEGYFDVLELSSGEFLYGENSTEYSKNLIKLIDFKKSEGTFHGLKYFPVNDNDAAIIDQTIPAFNNTLWATAKIINYHNKVANFDTSMKKIFKFIFIDIGLGIHIPYVIENTGAKIIYIQEDNLELFRLSMFTTSYREISKSAQIFFSVAEAADTSGNIFLSFLDEGFNYNLHIKYLPFYKEYKPKLRILQSLVYQQPHLGYSYNAILLKNASAPKYIYENYNYLNVSKRRSIEPFNNLPVIIVASGPSTNREIAWLKDNRDRFIMVSPLSTCRFLHSHDLMPDIVVHIDAQGEASARLFNDLPDDYFDNIITILASYNAETTVKKFKRENIYFIGDSAEFKKGFRGLSAPSVGEYIYALLMLLGANNLYILGIDLALDTETYETHAGLHPDNLTYSKDQDNDDANVYKSTVMYVPGNFETTVPTIPSYNMSINQFNYFSLNLQSQDQKVYNLSYGAKLSGATATKAQEISTHLFERLDLKKINQKINHSFHAISENSPSKEDILLLKHEIKGANKILSYILKYEKTPKTIDQYIESLSTFHTKLTGTDRKESFMLDEVFTYFFKIFYIYVFDIINTQDLNNIQTIILDIDTIMTSQTKKIATYYIRELEKNLGL